MRTLATISVSITTIAVLGLLGTLASCVKRHGSPGGSDPPRAGDTPRKEIDPQQTRSFTEDELNARDDVVGYARYCKQELEIPSTPLAPWNCLEGVEIPVTIDGQALTEELYPDLARRKIGCDLPAWLAQEPCANYAFAQKRTLAPDVEAIFLCRMRHFTNPDNAAQRRAKLMSNPSKENFESYYNFDSMALIWTNKKSGETCYFATLGSAYGGYVPSPDDDRPTTWDSLPEPKPEKPAEQDGNATDSNSSTETTAAWQSDVRTIWRSPTVVANIDNCVRCHDTGPYKASPWIEQVFDVPSNPLNVPHIVVGSAFKTWQDYFPAQAISTTPITGPDNKQEPQVCTSCHRVGAHATCDEHLAYSVGSMSPGILSTLGSTFFYRTWMPPAPADWHGKKENELTSLWNTANQQHVNRLKCCCRNPNARGCTTQDFSKAPIPPPVEGQGPESCL